MVQIYNEITIYFYKAFFASGASTPNPRWEKCTYFWGVNTSWGIDMAERKGPLHQEYNQAPQPTISHLETDLNNSTAAVYVGL
jgi:hypothetical protein